MAYLQFEEIQGSAAVIASRTAQPTLDALDREVVRMSFNDHRSSLKEPAWLARIGIWMGSIRRKNGLANPRLELLRRYAILYRLKGKTLSANEELALVGAGYDLAAIREVRRLVDRHVAGKAGSRRPGLRGTLPVLAMIAAFACMMLLVERAAGDFAVSAMVAALISVTLLSLHRPATQPG